MAVRSELFTQVIQSVVNFNPPKILPSPKLGGHLYLFIELLFTSDQLEPARIEPNSEDRPSKLHHPQAGCNPLPQTIDDPMNLDDEQVQQPVTDHTI